MFTMRAQDGIMRIEFLWCFRQRRRNAVGIIIRFAAEADHTYHDADEHCVREEPDKEHCAQHHACGRAFLVYDVGS